MNETTNQKLAKCTWKTGQECWLVPKFAPAAGRSVVIHRVGRKYLTLEGSACRFDFFGRSVDDHSELWPSREIYDAHMAVDDAITQLQKDLGRMDTRDVSVERIAKVRELLGLDP